MIRITQHISKYVPIEILDGERVKVNFGFEQFADEDEFGKKTPSSVGTWTVAIMKPIPTLEQLKAFVVEAINLHTNESIISGFLWNGKQIWLSAENQFNYKAAYDLAVQTNGGNLPLTFKFGATTEPIYHTFTTVNELQEFYLAAMQYVNDTLAAGWAKKDAIDWTPYAEALANLNKE